MFARSIPAAALALLPFNLLFVQGQGELSPPEFSVNPHFTAPQRAKFDGTPADVRAPRVGLDLGGEWTLSPRTKLGLAADFEHSHYRLFNFNRLLPGVSEPIRDAFQVKLSPRLTYALDEKWALVGGASVGWAGDPGAEVAKTFTMGGFVGAHRQFNEHFGMTFGAAAATRLEDHVHLLPFVGVDWQISKRWRLAMAGASGRLNYALSETVHLFLGLAYETHEFRFADDSSIPGGVLRDQSVPISIGVDWQPSPSARVTFAVGSAFSPSYRVRDAQGHTLLDKDAKGAPFMSLGVNLGFGGRRGKATEAGEVPPSVPMPPSVDGDDSLAGHTLKLWEENDSMSGTDDNYSQGAQLAYLAPEHCLGDMPAWLRWFGEGLPALGFEVERARGTFTAGQLIFTPLNITATALQVGDHPYAGWIYGAPALQRRGQTAGGIAVLEEVRLGLGWMGPGALGGEAQNFIHRNFEINLARGWQNQLRNEPTADFTYARAGRILLAGEREGGAVDFIPHLALVGGTPRTQAAAGGTVRIGVNLPDDFGQTTIQSTLPISGGAAQAYGVYLFAAVEGRAVARDGFLDGSLWRSGYHVASEPLGLETRVGFAVTRHSVDFGFTYARQSPEFKGQHFGNHDYGSLWLNWRI